ncbi:M20 family metallo-hydrolase [Candidatus Entotheonella palauensis]|uniref:Acetylornithine deacetylase n=1 Tax=Candidatus Entotheonella gemina TaxID=1429439 RepID=W4LWT6_9BACT|nr:M20 family metallo-hydrolase [Candidatus Entotheonella palauensis]ETX02380.1 MAG: acetylornithine deacetylase [Candidatus Entotheonella gemina]
MTLPIDEQRLWNRHMTMAQIGATPKGGVNRQALSPEDVQARQLLTSWARELGFTVSTDEIGNLFVRREGSESHAAPVLTGSHLDSQPTGGKFDGAYGVLAGFEALQAIHETGVATKRPLEVVAWVNEEGSRFQPGCTGSLIFSGKARLDDLLAHVDPAGIKFGDALQDSLKALPDIARRSTGFDVDTYIEAHIEQGPRLEAEGLPIGIVTGIQGMHRYSVEVVGEEAHAGTAPLKTRKDALKAAAEMVGALEEVMADDTDTVRFTVGRFEVSPGSPNTVPGRVFFTIDFRHPIQETIDRLTARIEPVCRAHARGCQVVVTQISATSPVHFGTNTIDAIRQQAANLGLPHMDLFSGAGHDAGHLASVCPAGMVFVPCEKGISHNEVENARPADLAAGAQVLASFLLERANR